MAALLGEINGNGRVVAVIDLGSNSCACLWPASPPQVSCAF